MDDLTIGSANGPAYEKHELRSGPPLDYVAGKMRSSLDSLRSAYLLAKENGSEFGERLHLNMYAGFKYELTAYLALYNLLNMANDRALTDRLLGCSDEEFDGWLDRVRSEGSVTG